MKTHLIYGLAMAGAGAVLTLLANLLGWHNETDKFLVGIIVGFIGAFAIAIICLILGMRAVRNASGARGLSYGQAFKTGLLITIFAVLFGGIFNFAYFGYINPGYTETAIEWTTGLMERGNVPSDKIAETEAKMRADSTPAKQARSGVVAGLISGTILSLIIAAFLRRAPAEEPAPVQP